MQQKYSLTLRILHWLIALMLIVMIGVGWYMAGLPQESEIKYEIYPWHKSFGITILGLVIIRIVVRLFSNNPPLPSGLATWEKWLTKVTHALFYILMIAIPVVGYLSSDYQGFDVEWFGVPIPGLVADNEDTAHLMHEVHEILAYSLLLLIILHLAGTIKHRWFDKGSDTDVLKRML
ncbi:cytochrome b [Kangiella sp.]|uniref:cytochrome b n=1 Tax=Kangiella sp. TaxID=1920245 RepID=UPI003A945B34